MESVLFPRGFLDTQDIPAVASLSSAQKYLWSMSCLHANAAGVVYFSATFIASLGLVLSVARQLACELESRGLVVIDEKTSELFISHWFCWQKTPATAGGDKWSKQVTTAISKVKSAEVQSAVRHAVEKAPAEKMEVVQVPTNLVSALRHPTPGRRWEATPALLLLAIYTWPGMRWGGVCVGDYEAWSTYVSASGPEQIIGHLGDMDRAGNIVFDFGTGEVFLPARLKNANPAWHMQEILATRSECVSHRVKTNFSRLFTRTFGKFTDKSDTCAPVDFSLVKYSSSRAAPPPAAASLKEGWLKTETHPLTVKALESLARAALSKNKRSSDQGLDAARCRMALEFCEKNNLLDTLAAKVVGSAAWPNDLDKLLKEVQAKLNHERIAANRKEDERRVGERVAINTEARQLIGKTLINQSTKTKIVVKKFGASIGGQAMPLDCILEMLKQGLLEEAHEEELAA